MSDIKTTLTTAPKALPPSDQLGFGQYFTDHMFVAKYMEGKGWYDAQILPYGPLPLDPGASVFHYGQALFEGMKAFRQADGKIVFFRPEFNHDRMAQGAERMCLEAPPLDLFMQGLHELVKVDQRWIPHEPNTALYIRPTLIGTESFLGVRPSRETMFFILLSPVGSYYSEGTKPVKIWTEEKYLRAAPGGLGAVKAGANYASSLKAALEAKKKGYAQVLWLDVEHQGIEEVGTMNVFFVFKNEIVTPALNGSILNGGTRDAIIELLHSKNLPIVERKITITEVVERLQKGELLEAFGTGTAAVISPIGELHYQGKDWVINGGQTGELSTKLYNEITSIQRGQMPDTQGWITPLV
ncbi:branched-chain amino acid aminotransferase [Bdellovibrio svalbardensis]|uniref:branched-chain-amino-acid transaminase n=1 Tax=Bdellovibrio svalbardensis TaxID=2972972 RepID=A0ABT6DLQ5_9BACT|nr:branched-chain amino acid aminotransferase [Bdellovibrio svalbardensis]MDG0817581.1 branched-chain amino acid aminotransferase [Bdellovibrio svalbardensis]